MSHLAKRFWVIVAFAVSPAAPAFAADLVGYWNFEEGSSAQALDQSDSGNHGGLTGAVRSAGKIGQGVTCGGSGCVTVPHSATLDSLPSGFTFSAWVNPASGTAGYTTLFSKSPDPFNSDPAQVQNQLHLRLHDNGHLQFVLNNHIDYGGFQGFTAAGLVPANAWSHIAWTYDEAMHRIYVNGVEVFNAGFSQAWSGSTVPLTLGQGLEPFNGMLDEARLYHGALSPEQVLAEMNFGTGPATLEDLLRPVAAEYTVELINGPLDLAGVSCGGTLAADADGVVFAYQEGGLVDHLVRVPLAGPPEILAEGGALGIPTSACQLSREPNGDLLVMLQRPVFNAPAEYYLVRLVEPLPLITEPVATPVIAPPGATFSSSVLVTLTTATSGAEIRYTVDGSTPNELSSLYAGPIPVNATLTLKAKGFKANQTDSAVASANFIRQTPSQPLALPATGTSSRSSGWLSMTGTNDLWYWAAGQWLEYQVDFGSGGSWTISATATNHNSASEPGLPSGYQYNLDVRLDGTFVGALKVVGSTTGYRNGSLAINAPAGVHTVRLTWTNDAWTSGLYDANIQIREVLFSPAAFIVAAGSAKPRLMPAGASITVGDGDDDFLGYRDHLQARAGLTTYNFVGSFKTPSSHPTYDVDHEGVGGHRTDQLQARLTTALPVRMPAPNPAGSAILIHVGTNDITQNVPEATAMANIANIVNLIHAHDSTISVYVALLAPSTVPSFDAKITSFNSALATQLANLQASKPNVYAVDMNTVFKQHAGWEAAYFTDDVHPNNAGYQLMAIEWDQQLRLHG